MGHKQYGKRAGGCTKDAAIYQNATRQNNPGGGGSVHPCKSAGECSGCGHLSYACRCIGRKFSVTPKELDEMNRRLEANHVR